MKGLFKSKPRTPAEIVRHTRELLIYVDLNSNSRDTKREEKVNHPIAIPCSYPSLCFLRHLFVFVLIYLAFCLMVLDLRTMVVLRRRACPVDCSLEYLYLDELLLLTVMFNSSMQMAELCKNIRELKSILYGNSDSEPVAEACAQLTQEFFRENTLRLLIVCLPKLNLEVLKDATQVVANLQRQQVHSRLIASDYLEANKDLLDLLISGLQNIISNSAAIEDMDIALHYGAMLRECIHINFPYTGMF
ncbi:unnamed protein product [Musa acuminata var. zebrina]